MRICVTGGTSFIGMNLIRRLRKEFPDARIGQITRQQIAHADVKVSTIQHDLRAPLNERMLAQLEGVDVIVHAAALVSAGYSLEHPEEVVQTNVMGTFHMLEAARILKPKRFIFISTGEVLGHVDAPNVLDESAPLRPSDPYGASKAAGEELCRSWRESFGVPTIIVRPMNVFGPGQKLPRFVPDVVLKIMHCDPVPCNTSESGEIESRNRMHVDECCKWLVKIITEGVVGETYHVFGPEIDNLEIINAIVSCFPGSSNRSRVYSRIVPGRDLRYSAKDTKLGITLSKEAMLESLRETVDWYKENPGCLGVCR